MKHKSAIAIPVVAVLLLVYVFAFGGNDKPKPASAEPPATTTTSSTTTTEGTGVATTLPCANTWYIVHADNNQNRWFADGVVEIRNADNDAKAKEAARAWLTRVKHDPELLAGASAYFLNRQVDPSTLVSGECATADAAKLVAELELKLAEAKVTPATAPANGVNSGVAVSGLVVAASSPGVTGDRKAIKVEFKDSAGKTVELWIMARCGNPVVTTTPPVPKGPTDENPTKVPPTIPPKTTTTVGPTTTVQVTTTTVKGSTTTVTVPATTSTVVTTTTRGSGKEVPATTTPPPPVTAKPPVTTTKVAPATTTTTPRPATTVKVTPTTIPDSGDGGHTTVVPPTTVAPPATLPPTSVPRSGGSPNV